MGRYNRLNIGGFHSLGKSAGATEAMNSNMGLARRQGMRESNRALLQIGMQVAGLFIGGGLATGGLAKAAAAGAGQQLAKGLLSPNQQSQQQNEDSYLKEYGFGAN